MILEMIFSASLVIKGLLIHFANVYDHTTLKAPHPARSAKLSNVGLTSVPESETVWEHAVSCDDRLSHAVSFVTLIGLQSWLSLFDDAAVSCFPPLCRCPAAAFSPIRHLPLHCSSSLSSREIQVLRFCLCPLHNNAIRNVPLNPGFFDLQILPSVWSSLFDSVSVSSWLLSSSSDRKSCTPMTEMAVTNETSCDLLFVERLLMIDQLVGTTRLPQGESPPGQSALAVTMDYTTADPRHSRIDGNAVGMLQISVYRQRFVRSCQSAENEPKDAEQTEEELHPVERIVKYSPRIAKTSTGEDRRATQVKYAKSTLRPRVTPVSTQFYSPLLGAGYLRRRGGARYLRRRPKSPSASSKPSGFGSFHLRLVRGAGGQLAIPLRRLLLQGRRLTFRRRVSPDPEPGSPDAVIAIYSTLRAHCSCPSPHLMSTGSWMCHR
ncbi:hypothetical protein T05_11847 [Trichinella murrelli]|uniref:Uncharacterized protein n=1 Tax=Trichinella murrelli TaxID=144512 RepID=A0A0V0TA61_9BILA|nr:hypothetical protein T05_11847 [Trichinella murrelli]